MAKEQDTVKCSCGMSNLTVTPAGLLPAHVNLSGYSCPHRVVPTKKPQHKDQRK